MIELDGSHGGGALLRTALALSTHTGKPFFIKNIRSKREQPGLKQQHVTAINALKQICGAVVTPYTLGTQELEYIPKKIKGGSYNFDIKTAGSITLFLQSIILPLLYSEKKSSITVIGGTCGKWQASVEYFMCVMLPHLNGINLRLIKKGYYPKGGGCVKIVITPQKKKPVILLRQGRLLHVKGVSHASSDLMQREVASRLAQAAKDIIDVDVQVQYQNTESTGCGIILYALFGDGYEINRLNPVILGSDIVCEKGIRAEEIGKKAALLLKKEMESGCAADKYLADQLIPFMCPNSSILTSKITDHVLANIYVTEKFLDVKYKIEGKRITVQSSG